MELYSQDAIVCGYPGEVHLLLQIYMGKLQIDSSRTNLWHDRWESYCFFDEENTQKVLSLLGTTGSVDTGEILIEKFCPEDNTPSDGYDNTNIMGQFFSAILEYFSKNEIHWTTKERTWYDDIQKETINTYYH